MLFHIPEFDCYLLISAFRVGSVDPREILQSAQSESKNATIQFVDLERTAGHRHVLLATYNALKSQSTNQMISRSLPIEILLYVAGDHQIAQAVNRVGVRVDTEKIVVIALTKSRKETPEINDYLSKFNLKIDDSLLDEWTSRRKSTVRALFSLSRNELQAASRKGERSERAIQRMVIEKSAVLAVKK